MGASAGNDSIRVLGLGNEILADDAFGILAAREVRRHFGRVVDVVESSDAGFNLLDSLLNTGRLLVVDTIETRQAAPGTIRLYRAEDWQPAMPAAPHLTGLFEVLALAKALDLPAPREVAIFVVEAADCLTVGGAMDPDVQAAIPAAVDWVAGYLGKRDA